MGVSILYFFTEFFTFRIIFIRRGNQNIVINEEESKILQNVLPQIIRYEKKSNRKKHVV